MTNENNTFLNQIKELELDKDALSDETEDLREVKQEMESKQQLLEEQLQQLQARHYDSVSDVQRQEQELLQV